MRRDISITHHSHGDALSADTASAESLLNLAASVLTWSHVAQKLKLGEAEMDQQVELVQRLIDSFNAGHQGGLESADLELARDGVVVMDLLAGHADVQVAAWAAEKSASLLKQQFLLREPPTP